MQTAIAATLDIPVLGTLTVLFLSAFYAIRDRLPRTARAFLHAPARVFVAAIRSNTVVAEIMLALIEGGIGIYLITWDWVPFFKWINPSIFAALDAVFPAQAWSIAFLAVSAGHCIGLLTDSLSIRTAASFMSLFLLIPYSSLFLCTASPPPISAVFPGLIVGAFFCCLGIDPPPPDRAATARSSNADRYS